MKRVLITGAAGFLGANLTRRMLERGHEVHALVRPGSDEWRIEEIRSDLRVCPVDMLDGDSIRRAVAEARPDWVLHLAAYGSHSWETDAERIWRTNVDGTIALVEACQGAGCERFIHTGSSSEYGFKDHGPSEDERAEPSGDYAASKLAATEHCHRTVQSARMSIATLRLYSVYGPFESPRRLIPTLIVHGLRGELPALVNPDVARDFVYVDDVCDAYEACLGTDDSTDAQIFNVGTGVQTTIRDTVAVACDLFTIEAGPSWGSMPSRTWDTPTWICNPARIRRVLRWSHRHGFAAGFRATARWFAEHPAMLDRYRGLSAQPTAP